MPRQPKWQAQYLAARRAQFALKQKLERIDWEYDVLDSDLAQIQIEAATNGTLPEITVGDADPAE